MQLQDKVAIVTGAGSGIGRATALLFANEGAQVVAADIIGERAEETRSLAGETSTRITPSRTDVSKSADVERMVNKTLEDYGRTDILVSNAGMMIKKPAEEMTEDEWDRLMGVNLKGVWLCAKYVIPHMKEAGSGVIVNTASTVGLQGSRMSAAYSASKGGVIQLTKSLAITLASHGIRVNAVCPGATDTEMARGSGGWDAMSGLYPIPIGRIAAPEEIAKAMLFLASDAASYITGSIVPVDGGWTAG